MFVTALLLGPLPVGGMTWRTNDSSVALAECEKERTHQVQRDMQFARMQQLPEIVDVETFRLEEMRGCSSVTRGMGPVAPRVVFFMIVYKDFGMIERVVERLRLVGRHAFVLHITDDVSPDFEQQLLDLSERVDAVCILKGGYIAYESSTDVVVAFSYMSWLLGQGEDWDFTVLMSGADYPLMSGLRLNQELQRSGNLTWDLSDPAWWPQRMTRWQTTCAALGGSSREEVPGRDPWILRLLPEMQSMKGRSLLSTGILHRRAVAFLVEDLRARMAFNFFSLIFSGSEHYIQSTLTLPAMRPHILRREAAYMSWTQGRMVGQGLVSNTFLTMEQWPQIGASIEMSVPFARKFDSVLDREVLDRIDEGCDGLGCGI